MSEGTRPLIYGVGVNDADYPVTHQRCITREDGTLSKQLEWACPFYAKWKAMISRCMSAKFKARSKSYKDVSCCPEWLIFSKFKQWMELQDWHGKQLDKDIIVEGNSIYCPETASFVSRETNMFLADCGKKIGDLPRGVSLKRKTGRYQARCKVGKREEKYLGTFDTAEQAHQAWRAEKHRIALLLAEEQSDPRVAAALRVRFLNTTSTEGKDHE